SRAKTIAETRNETTISGQGRPMPWARCFHKFIWPKNHAIVPRANAWLARSWGAIAMHATGANQSSGQMGCSPVPKYKSAAVVVPATNTRRSLKDFISGIPRAPLKSDQEVRKANHQIQAIRKS